MDRVFFALKLAPELRAAAGQLARIAAHDARGRAVPEDNLHLTLVFVGEVAPSALAVLTRIGASVAQSRVSGGAGRGHAGSVTLDRLGAFPRAQVAWLAPSSAPKWLARLVEALEQALDAEGIAFDRRAHHPHLTLARSCRGPYSEREVDPTVWVPGGFELLRSPRGVAGGRYETLSRWSFGVRAP